MSATTLSYRTVFISDVHLGSQHCQAEYLLDFLHTVECETLYLVGDIVDLLAMRRRTHWPESHTAVIRAILGKARRGTRVIYIPGNHDAEVGTLAGGRWHGVEIRRRAIHRMVDGRRLMVAHGDEFERRHAVGPIVHAIGDRGHGLLLGLNRWCNLGRRWLGLHYWPLAVRVKNALAASRRYQRAYELHVLREMRRRGLDGFVGGHLHMAGIRVAGGLLYCNDGDWVEHCTALVEDRGGALSLLQWTERQHVLAQKPVDDTLGAAAQAA